MQRILVAGITGAGKTTMARAVAERLDLPFHEMDALAFAGPGWQENQHLVRDIEAVSAAPGWVFDSYGYPEVRDLLWTRADTVVWLDYPRRVVMRRVLRRPVRRTVLRERIFGGNVETLSGWFSAEHPAWWAWSQHGSRRVEVGRRVLDPRFAPLEVVRFTSPRRAR